ncbi:putative nucleosome assembly protein [Colletotrichum spinosum]|uniref:Putative nucleosome assembly protein n=2 Tax=Colletotrichum orbiculare species complex TaxID=2707354 RepID=A0A4R8S049_COLTR|nr:putative nucleosome assembly protein [Colletotrichum spinosum]TDZ74262.1 putative nucleosome assembly protein [Colletotrichum trifolii]
MVEMVDTGVTYEELADIEQEFEQVETEMLRKQYELSRPLYEKRAAIVAKIPNFWPLVFEQSPPEIDEYIQPSDASVLLASLKNVSVTRFELENGQNGDPRSIAIRFEFKSNDHFENEVLEKKFWWRTSPNYTGLVSEPVNIKWKPGKDLTDGLLDAVQKVWDQGGPVLTGKGKPEPTAEAKALKQKIEDNSMDAVSFFCWFGYVGKRISAEESAATLAKEAEDLRKRKAGEKVEEEEEDDEEDEFEYEIFPDGDDIAQAIAQDLWPDALSYFTQAQEAGELSDADFETEDEDEDEEMEG